jgi:Uma2 family endonuclease
VRISPERYLETIPELVVEVRSKNDTKPYIERKVSDYLDVGVQLVWVVDPDKSIVVEHRPGATPNTLSSSDSLQCEDVIPGFRLALSELFT